MNEIVVDIIITSKRKIDRTKPEFPSELKDPQAELKINEQVEELLPHAADIIGIAEGELSKNYLGTRLIYEDTINAIAKTNFPEEKPSFEITLYMGLVNFIFKMVTLFASRVGVSDGGKAIKDPEIPFNVSLNYANKLISAYWRDPIYGKEMMKEKGIDITKLTGHQLIFSAVILYGALRFALGHELAHVVIRMKKSNEEEIAELDYEKKFVSNIPNVPDSFPEAWYEELAADIIGLYLAVQDAENDKDRIDIYSAADWLLLQYMILEAFYLKKTNEVNLSYSHPPAALRIINLRTHMESTNPPRVFQMAEAFEYIASEFIDSLDISPEKKKTKKKKAGDKGEKKSRFFKKRRGKKKLASAFWCHNCKNTLAVFWQPTEKEIELWRKMIAGKVNVMDKDEGMFKAWNEFYKKRCPQCGEILDETRVPLHMIKDEEISKELVELAKKDGIFYE
jgi:hypothetical protein